MADQKAPATAHSAPSLAASWSTEQLAQFLEVFGALGDTPIRQMAMDRVVESLDAEVVALVEAGRVSCSRGFAAGSEPADELIQACRVRSREAELGDLGPLHTSVVSVDRSSQSYLLVARPQPAFDREEDALLRVMGRALALALHNAELVDQLGERQQLSERLFRIEQSISHRAPLQEVLDTITRGAAELLNADVVGIRLVLHDPPGDYSSMWGVSAPLKAAFAETQLTDGFSGRAFVQNQLTVTDNYAAEIDRTDGDGVYQTHAAMAAPIHRDGNPTGVISVASTDVARKFSDAEREVLLLFAQHVSLAVNDASAAGRMRRSLAQTTHMASHDDLTGLPNRSAIIGQLDVALATASEQAPLSLLFVDIDRFKTINDVYGHAAGDEVLVQVGRRLASTVRSGDVVARLAGDEFLVMASGLHQRRAEELAERVAMAVAEPVHVQQRELALTASIGVALAVEPTGGEDLLADADVAMYRAKQFGRSTVVHFDSAMRTELRERTELESQLHAALNTQGQLRVHYQPVFRVEDLQVEGFEALIRWEQPEIGMIAPGQFVPLAEETGQITEIDRFALKTAVAQLAEWRRSAARHADLTMAVNVSARQFGDEYLVPSVAEVLQRFDLPPEALGIEITETTLMEETAETLVSLNALRELRVGLAIDDFGTGHSSLGYLKRFPVDTLKIDRSFVAGLCHDRDDEAIVTATIRLADALGLKTVAEGVESEEQLEWLREQGCQLAQGFVLARPGPASEIERLYLAPSSAPGLANL